jgi:RNA polymerase sigma-70 factor (ECF subfamily)
MDTSASLLERLRQPGQEQAWARLVELYTPLSYSWARRAGLQYQDAADLVQDVFAILVRKLPEFSYDKQRSFRAWLRTLLMHRWRDGRRRQAARPAEVGHAELDGLDGGTATGAFPTSRSRSEDFLKAAPLPSRAAGRQNSTRYNRQHRTTKNGASQGARLDG